MTTQWSYLIYGLVDPRTGLVRYIGKSSSGMRRPRNHLKPSHIANDYNRHKANWLLGLKKIGMRAGIRVIEEVSHREMLDESEQWWIRCARSLGWPLTNISMGGEGGHRCAPETRAKISAALKGHSVSEATKEATRRANRERESYIRTPEMRRAASERQLGKEITGTHLSNLRAAVVRREEKRRHNKRAQSVRDGQGDANATS